jgi:hypothetical protein
MAQVDAFAAAAGMSQREQLLIAASRGYAPSVAALPDKLAAIKAASAALHGSGVAHALIGGLAVGIRSGVPRATLDVDLAIPSTIDRAATIRALLGAGFALIGEFPHSINFKHESGEPVQLAFDPGFDAMIRRAELVDVGGLLLAVVTRDDLLAMKRRAADDPGRRRSKALRDRADIALLEGDIPDENEGW